MLMLTGWAWAGEPCAPGAAGRVPQIEEGMLFRVGKAELLPEAEPALKELVCLLEREPGWSVRVEVYSDTMGSGEYNLRMSQARAEAVRSALGERGIETGRVSPVGYGESPQRRVEVYVGPSPDAGRPPAPVPAPVPVVEKPAPIDWCARARAVTGAIPRWSGARCEDDGITWICVTAQPPEEIVKSLSACVRVLQDGDSWYATVPEGTMVLSPRAEGTALNWH